MAAELVHSHPFRWSQWLQEFGLTDDVAKAFARASIDASFAGQTTKSDLLKALASLWASFQLQSLRWTGVDSWAATGPNESKPSVHVMGKWSVVYCQ